MGQVWTREDWNQLIRDVNAVLQNPPADTDCSAIDAIDEVDAGHVWAKSDIREVQDKLKQTCTDISFDDIPDKWLQSIIDDINTAKGKAWCHCNPNGGGGGGGGGLPPSPSGHWVIVLCDCASGTIRMTDADGNCIPFCQGCVGPFRYSNNIVWSGTDGSIAQQMVASFNSNEYDSCTHMPLAPYRLLAAETWTAMVTGHAGDSWIGSCTCS